GAGIGNLTGRLMSRKLSYLAAEKDPLYLHALRNRFLRTPNVTVRQLDPENPPTHLGWSDQFDTALCINVLESVKDPAAVLGSVRGWVKPGGNVIVLVPQGKALFGSLDRALGHQHRFSVREVSELLTGAGFRMERVYQLNKIGAVSWLIY